MTGRRLGAAAGLGVLLVASALASAAGGASPARRGFVSSVAPVSAASLGGSWRAGCPVGPSALRAVRLTYFGFDGKIHLGTMVLNAAVVAPVVSVFAHLYAQRFPIAKMVPQAAFGGSDPASMAADNTSAFNCRYAVAPGPKHWSVHAYGEAIDVDPLQNPYLEGGRVQPAAGRPFLDRADVRPGMAVLGGVLVRAFATIGWLWGGRWTSSPDYQHFSLTGG